MPGFHPLYMIWSLFTILPPTLQKNDFAEYSRVSQIKGKAGTPDLVFKQGQREVDGKKIIGTIESVKTNSKEEEEIEVSFANNTKKKKIHSPAYSIGAMPDSVMETAGNGGNWAKWVPYLKRKSNAISINEGAKPPGVVEKISTIRLELFPFYSSLEKGNVSMVEMGAPMQELNGIIYGKDKTKINSLFGTEKVFTIKWKYELKNLSTNQIITDPNKKLITTNGKWADNKIEFTYPDTNDLLGLTITATISDAMGVVAVKPVELIFYSQRIAVAKDAPMPDNWIDGTGKAGRKEFLLKRFSYLTEDGVLMPDEIISLFK